MKLKYYKTIQDIFVVLLYVESSSAKRTKNFLWKHVHWPFLWPINWPSRFSCFMWLTNKNTNTLTPHYKVTTLEVVLIHHVIKGHVGYEIQICFALVSVYSTGIIKDTHFYFCRPFLFCVYKTLCNITTTDRKRSRLIL